MDTKELYSWINQHQNSISNCQGQIRKLEEEIEELTDLQNKIQYYENDFSIVQGRRERNLSNAIFYLHTANRYSKKILKGVENDMGEVLTGTEKTNTKNKLYNAIEIIRAEIASRKGSIDTCQNDINQYRNKISSLQSQIQEIERQKVLEAERAKEWEEKKAKEKEKENERRSRRR